MRSQRRFTQRNRPSALALAWVAGAALSVIGAASAGAEAPLPGPVPPEARYAPQDLVQQTTERLLAAVNRDREAVYHNPELGYRLVDEYASPHVDYERISSRVLGRHWARASEAQRARFVEEFRALLIRTYASAVSNYADAEIVYLPSNVDAERNTVTVRTQIPQRGGSPLAVDYRLYEVDGRWKVYDLLVQGVSLMITHRASFTHEADKLGLDGLIERLSTKNGQSG